MRQKIYQAIFLFVLANTACGQSISTNSILRSIWYLENDKFEEYQTYLYFNNNKIYKFELKNKRLFKSNDYKFSNYCFLSDSTFNILVNDVSDAELSKFFNKNKILLLKDNIIDLKKEISMTNVIHFNYQNDTISGSHMYAYQFYNKNTFIQFGYGWTPGQPQTGYIYSLATNVPRSVMFEIQRINPLFFLEIKSTKSYIHKTPSMQSNNYVVKDDIVEVIEEKGNWLKIRYYGKKTVEGWIKKSDVE